jgi:hypothetical protein
MDVGATFISNLEPSQTVQPRVGALDDPTMTAQLLLRLDAFTGDSRRDATPAQGGLVLLRLVSLIRVQFVGTFARPSSGTSNRVDGVKGRPKHRGLVDIGRGQQDRQRNALAVDHKMALRALFAAIRWILPGFFAPPGEGTVEASMAARLQSMRSAWPSRSNRTWWRRSQTPAFCQSRRRRQQVMPLPQPNSLGSISHGMPLRRTKRIPVKAARSDTRGRPPFGFGLSGGNKGAMRSHSLSSRYVRIMRPRITQAHGFVRRS